MCTAPAGGRAQACDHFDQLCLSVALDAGDADDFPAAHVERDAAQGRLAKIIGRLQVVELQEHLARGCRLLLYLERDLSPNHHCSQFLLRDGFRVGFADQFTSPQHGDAVGDAENLLELMGDEDNRLSLAAEQLHHGEETFYLLRRQNGSRLVENQDIGLPVERLEDFDALLKTDGEVLDYCVGVDRHVVPFGQLTDVCRDALPVEEAFADALAAQHDVVDNTHHGHQLEVLMDHADAQLYCVAGRLHLYAASIDQNFALGRLIEAVDNVHQGGLAGPIFAEQGQYLAATERQIDLLVGDDSGEELGDLTNFKFGLHVAVLAVGRVLQPAHALPSVS